MNQTAGMDFATMVQVLQTASIVIGIVVALGTLRSRKDSQVVTLATIQKDIEFIKEKINGYDTVRDVANGAAQSASSAHKRLDEHLRQEHGKDLPGR